MQEDQESSVDLGEEGSKTVQEILLLVWILTQQSTKLWSKQNLKAFFLTEKNPLRTPFPKENHRKVNVNENLFDLS